MTAWPSLRLSPGGHLLLREPASGDPGRLTEAFRRGAGWGLLALGTDELATALPAPLAFWRELAKLYLTRLCAIADLDQRRKAEVPVSEDELDGLAAQAPPFEGAEYLSAEALSGLWASLGEAVATEGAGYASLAAFLAARAPLWRRVGKVCFNLAENRRDPSSPFAFLATFAHGISAHGSVQHVPLGRALELYGGARDRETLLRLLEPLHLAARAEPVVEQLVESGAIYQPLAFTAREAYALLRAVPSIEAAGVSVKVPDWWKARPRPAVQVRVGGKPPAKMGADALLDFSVSVALGDEPLSDEELRALLAAGEGLVLLRGRWVEVDREKLEQALAHWKDVERLVRKEGISFSEAMRLLAGFSRKDLGHDEGPEASWSRVVAGDWLAGVLASMRDPARSQAERASLAELKATLRPYQEVGVRWLRALTSLGLGACLADDMGLGKTIQVIGALLLRRATAPAEAHLIVAPTSLLANWSAELARFAPSLRVAVAHASAGAKKGQAQALDGIDVVLTTYGMLTRAAWLGERAWGLIVLDEAQAIKNPSARQTRAAKALRGAARVAVTGTPVENRLGDLWSIFDFLSPGLLGSARAFSSFVKASEKRQGSLGKLRALVRPYLLRRLKTDRSILPDLPDKTELLAHCLLSRRQAALYAAEVESLRQSLASRDGMARKGAILAAMVRLKQLCDHPSLLLGDGGFAPGDSGKFDRLAELCDEISQRQERALVFTQFREMTGPLQAFLTELFGAPGLCLHGGTPVPRRRQMVEQFQRDDGPPFFVVSLKAGGVGLNLTAASHVIHFDRWWNPAVEDQATDRAHRIGQRRHVLVHKMVCRGTIDERIDALIQSKRGLSREILEGGAEAALTELSDDEILDLVRLDLDAISGDA